MEDDEARTYSIWWFAAVFVALVFVGGLSVLAFGTFDRQETERLVADEDAIVDDVTSTTAATEVTLLDGTPAPEEVTEVESSPGQHTYLFELPDEFDGAVTASIVPEATVTRSEDERFLTVTMSCAVSAAAVPEVLQISEDPFEVNVTPVVTGPSFGAPCPPDATVGTITVALEEPVGSRRLVVRRAGELIGADRPQ